MGFGLSLRARACCVCVILQSNAVRAFWLGSISYEVQSFVQIIGRVLFLAFLNDCFRTTNNPCSAFQVVLPQALSPPPEKYYNMSENWDEYVVRTRNKWTIGEIFSFFLELFSPKR